MFYFDIIFLLYQTKNNNIAIVEPYYIGIIPIINSLAYEFVCLLKIIKLKPANLITYHQSFKTKHNAIPMKPQELFLITSNNHN